MDLTSFLDFFNWIGKADGIRGSAVSLVMGKGGGVHFDVLPPGGVTGGDIERMLRRYGIGMWGKRVTRENHDDPDMWDYWIAFDVRKSQAIWANYLIQRRGCRVMYKPTNAAAVHAVGMPVPWSGGDHQSRDSTGIEQPQVAGHLHAGELPKPAEQPAKVKRGWFDGLL